MCLKRPTQEGPRTYWALLLIDALFYADDAALLSTQTAEEASIRMAAIGKALREMADMETHMRSCTSIVQLDYKRSVAIQ